MPPALFTSATNQLHLWCWFAVELIGRAAGVYRTPSPEILWPSAPALAPPPSPQSPILFLGDSLTAGYGLPDPATQSFPALLSARLSIPIVNLARSGDTTADLLARFDTGLRPHLAPAPPAPSPRAIVLCIGGNDLLRRDPPDAMAARLALILNRLRSASPAPILLLGLRGSWLLRIDYDTPMRRLACATPTCTFVPLILRDIWGFPWLMTDPAHPNARGHARIAGRIEPALRRAFASS